jgi:hypothetical protein
VPADHDPADDEDEEFESHRHEYIPNYMASAILVTLFCCLPFGIVAIVKASEVNTFVATRHYRAARASSESAKTWCLVGALPSLVLIVIYICIMVSEGGRVGR